MKAIIKNKKSYYKKLSRWAFVTPIVALSFNSQAQLSVGGHFYGEDALRFSTETISGSARMQGMGGNYSSLGADASNNAGNPAGLGFYNRSELSISPVFSGFNNQTNYIGTGSNQSGSNAKIGQFGLVFNSSGVGTRKKRSSFAITYSLQNNYNNVFSYQGTNNRSSMIDYFAEKANARGANSTTLDNEFNPANGYSDTQTSMYYESYLIDVDKSGSVYSVGEPSLPVNQSGTVTTSGRKSQLTMGYGVNFDDKSYLGFSVGFPRVNYETINDHNETFTKGVNFNGFNYNDDLVVRGTGINLSVGGIIKVTDELQLGATITTPTALSMTETYYSGISINPKSFKTDFKTINTLPSDYSYKITTPMKASGGFTYFLPKKIGFITADAQYVGYRNMGVKDPDDSQWSNAQKQAIQNTYRDVINFKVGGEIRINQARLRVGMNYLADPVRNGKNSQLIPTLGAGYRTAKFFFDISGVFINSATSAYTPYQLNNVADYASASIKAKQNSIMFSVGTFF